MTRILKLGVNIDHVATVRNARGTIYPDPLKAAEIVKACGADGLTLHLREDRRHIKDDDVLRIRELVDIPMNLEMAATEEMLDFACKIKPAYCCLVPEKREELTTEGGLSVHSQREFIEYMCEELKEAGVAVSLFIDPEEKQIDAAKFAAAPLIELHSGRYANAVTETERQVELERIKSAATYAASLGIIVNAGHGLNCSNVKPIAEIPEINELNIGHSLIADALFVGLPEAIRQMRNLMNEARISSSVSS